MTTPNKAPTPRTKAATIIRHCDECGDLDFVSLKDMATLETELAEAKQASTELAAHNEKLRAALQRACFDLDWDVPHQPQTCGVLGKPLCYIHEALSTPPSDALKPWVEFVDSCSNRDMDSPDCGKGCLEEIRNQARQLLASIGK